MTHFYLYKEKNKIMCKVIENGNVSYTDDVIDILKYINHNSNKSEQTILKDNQLYFKIGDNKFHIEDLNYIKDKGYLHGILRVIRDRNYRIERNKKIVKIGSITLASALSICSFLNAIEKNKDVKVDIPYPTTIETHVDIKEKENNIDIKGNTIIFVDDKKEDLAKEDTTKEEPISVVTTETNTDINAIENIDIGSRSACEKAVKTRAYYYDLICKYANMYNVDPEIMCAIATQERGVHANYVDKGGGIGLMQIQASVWNGNDITAYNYETNQKEVMHITTEKLGNLDFNIKVACAIYQNNLKFYKNNELLTIQSYNFGFGNIDKVIREYCKKTNKNYQDVINDKSDTGWMNYTYVIGEGDPNYLNHVTSFLPENYEFNINNTIKK